MISSHAAASPSCSSPTCHLPPPRRRRNCPRRSPTPCAVAAPVATRTATSCTAAPAQTTGSSPPARRRRPRTPLAACAAGISAAAVDSHVKRLKKVELVRSQKVCENRVTEEQTCRWLLTSSLVSPSTFISSLICLGVAAASDTTPTEFSTVTKKPVR
jgi:hypothetical protein